MPASPDYAVSNFLAHTQLMTAVACPAAGTGTPPEMVQGPRADFLRDAQRFLVQGHQVGAAGPRASRCTRSHSSCSVWLKVKGLPCFSGGLRHSACTAILVPPAPACSAPSCLAGPAYAHRVSAHRLPRGQQQPGGLEACHWGLWWDAMGVGGRGEGPAGRVFLIPPFLTFRPVSGLLQAHVALSFCNPINLCP